MLMEGSVRIGIGDTFYDVHAGEGCFINTGILHSFIGLVPSRACTVLLCLIHRS